MLKSANEDLHKLKIKGLVIKYSYLGGNPLHTVFAILMTDEDRSLNVRMALGNLGKR